MNAIENWGDALQKLENTTDSIKGFCALLDMALSTTESSLKPDSSGIVSLLDHQVANLEKINSALNTEINNIRNQKLKVSDLSLIARAARVSLQEAEMVIKIATGINLGEEQKNGAYENNTIEKLIQQRFLIGVIASQDELEIAASVAGISAIALEKAFYVAMVFQRVKLEEMGREQYIRYLQDVPTRERELVQDDAFSKEEKVNAAPVLQARVNYDADAIAQTLKLKKTTVEKVIAELLNGKEANHEDQSGVKKIVNE